MFITILYRSIPVLFFTVGQIKSLYKKVIHIQYQTGKINMNMSIHKRLTSPSGGL